MNKEMECEICCQKASGFHYGATTCEACKVFFRRTNGKSVPSGPNCQGNCQPTSGKRPFSCPQCRLEKCLRTGMTVISGKRGRYSHEKKVEVITRIRNKNVANTSPIRTENSEDSSSEDPVKVGSPNDSEASAKENETNTDVMDLARLDHMQVGDMEGIVDHLCKVDKYLYSSWLPEKQGQDYYKYDQYLEERELLQDVFGTLAPMQPEEFNKFYCETGVDVDGRMAELMQMVPFVRRQIQCTIEFCKAVPRFNELPSQDKVALLKGFRAEDGIITYRHMGDSSKEMCVDPVNGTVYTTDTDVKWTGDEYFAKHIYRLAHKFDSFNTTKSEDVLMKAISLYSPDRCITVNGARIVQEVQQNMVQYFEKLVRENHPDDENMFGRLLLFLTDMRTYTAYYNYHVAKILHEFKYTLPLPMECFHMLSGEGLAYEATPPRCDDAPPAAKVKEVLMGTYGKPISSGINDFSLATEMDVA